MGIKKTTAFAILLVLGCAVSFAQNTTYGHEFVDLGLSVKWATCNIGGNSPEDYGEYFAWGETYPKSCYNKMTYKFAGETLGQKDLPTLEAQIKSMVDYTKYLGKENIINPDDVKLAPEDDVAQVKWGKEWRMPTIKEIEELVDSCNWIYGEVNAIKGYWAISKINGNKIFFPLAGYIYDDTLTDVGKSGKYWASELRKDMCFEAYQIWISHDDSLKDMLNKTSVIVSDDGYREYGRTVRPVYTKK